jgi:hypothetical protein
MKLTADELEQIAKTEAVRAHNVVISIIAPHRHYTRMMT